MKTILILIENSFLARNLLRTDFIKCLKEELGIRIVLLVPDKKFDYYKEEFGSENIVFGRMPKEPPLTFLEWVMWRLTLESIPTRAKQIRQYRAFYDKERKFLKRILYFLTGRTLWYLGKFSLWRKFLQLIYGLIPSPDNYSSLFNKYKPDLIFITNLLRYESFRLIKQARKRKIKTITQILSWDNLISKLFICQKADKFIVPNDLVKKELIYYGDVKGKDIFIAGMPQYDEYFKRDFLLPKKEFFKKIKADIGKKLVVYACAGKLASPIYSEIFDILYSLMRDSRIKYDIQFLVRGYPKRRFSDELKKKIKNYNFLLDEPAVYLGDPSNNNWELRENEISHVVNLISHADIMISSHSTFVIDACILNKPIININFDGFKNRPYWQSAKRLREFEHYNEVVKAKGERAVNNPEELVQVINEYLKNPELDREGRKKIVNEQCYYLDGKSGQRMVKFILEEIP